MAGKCERKAKDSIVSKLISREIRGDLQTNLRGNRARLFKKCPQRFCIPLANILDVNGVLRKGHVILGFTKSGRYLISYSLVIDTDDSCPLPHYAYSLHWWEFDQTNPLVEVFSVNLFGEEEIYQDLHLLVSESQDEAKVVVYGEIQTVKGDQSRQCYVTVCAAPSPRPCPNCRSKMAEKCLEHSFAIHFKYDLLAPFPLFNPSTSLKIRDSVIINTGDFLTALKVSTTSNRTNGLGDFIELFCASETESLTAPQECTKCTCPDGSVTETVSIGDSDESALSQQSAVGKNEGKFSAVEMGNCTCIGDCKNTSGENKDKKMSGRNDQRNSDVSENCRCTFGCSEHEDSAGVSSTADRRNMVSGFVDTLNEIHGKKTADQGNCHLTLTARQTEHDCGNQNVCAVGLESGSQLGNGESNEAVCCKRNEDQIFVKPSDPAQLSSCMKDRSRARSLDFQSEQETKVDVERGTPRNDQNLLNCSELEQNDRSLPTGSPEAGQNKDEGQCYKAMSGSSYLCGVVPTTVLNNNNLTSFMCKVYAATDSNDNSEEPELSDDFDIYDGSLPLTVKTCRGRNLKQVCKVNRNNPISRSNVPSEVLGNAALLSVTQVTLDLEQCIGELIVTHESLRHNYKSLRDYDVQLVGACPDTKEVVVMARILVYTRTRRSSASCGLPISPSPVLQCTGFTFTWNIRSGAVRVLQVLELEDYVDKRHSSFDMAAKEASELRSKCSTPQSISSAVKAFSNHTVFTGKSLKYIRHPFLPLVVVL